MLAVVLAYGLITGVVGINAAGGHHHVVREGDVLSRIARAHDTTWEALAEYNGLENPHLIFPGQVIHIPAQEEQACQQPPVLEQRLQLLQSLVDDVDTASLRAEVNFETLDYLAGYADILRVFFDLPDTHSDWDALWYLLDLLWTDDVAWEDRWQYLYEAGDPSILRDLFNIGPEVSSQELSIIVIVRVVAGDSEEVLAFLLDYVIMSVRTEIAVIYARLAEPE